MTFSGLLSSLVMAYHFYQPNQWYMKNYLLFLTLCCSCAYLNTTAQNADSSCNANFQYSIIGNTVKFIAASQARLHHWEFGDGSFSNDINPQHTYGGPGTYRVLQRVYDSLQSCFDTVSRLITISTGNTCNIEPAFSFYRDSLNCKKIHFINQSVPVSANVHFTWHFGDSTVSNDINPSHEYAVPGNYNVCLTIESGTDCHKELCKTVEARCDSCTLLVKFEWRKDSVHTSTVIFTNQTVVPSTGAQYQWSFGDGTTSADRNAVHTYNHPGTYQVCLKVSVNNTCIRELCQAIVIGANICNLQAAFEFMTDSMQRNKVFFFNHTLSNSSVVHYAWKFGDGTTSNDINPVHIYAQPGVYQVCLVAETGDSCRSEQCRNIEIRIELCNFTPGFEWRADSSHTNKIYFHNLTIVSSTSFRYLWNFGDGTSSSEINPVHEFAKPGEYQVCLVVELGNLCRKVTCQKIIIHVPECNVHAKFEWRQDGQVPDKIWFANTSQPVANIWKTNWSYGDGTSSQDFNSFHTYSNTGKYYVCLKVTSLNGCGSYFCDSVIVKPPVTTCDSAHVKFEYRRDSIKPNIISFTAVGNQSLVKQRWIFTRDSSVNGIPWQVVLEQNNPTFIFTVGGWYNVCLVATTANNCVKEYCEKIHIEAVVADSGHREIPIMVFPNPASHSVRLLLNLNSRASVSVTVLSAIGGLQQRMQVSGQAGNNMITIPVDKLSQGQYLVQLRYENQVRWARFQKL